MKSLATLIVPQELHLAEDVHDTSEFFSRSTGLLPRPDHAGLPYDVGGPVRRRDDPHERLADVQQRGAPDPRHAKLGGPRMALEGGEEGWRAGRPNPCRRAMRNQGVEFRL